MKLTRRPRFDGVDLPAYRHPNGWRIFKQKRDWSLRGMTRGASYSQASPMFWYEVYPTTGRRWQWPLESFDRLRDARVWCDRHRREFEHGVGYRTVEVDLDDAGSPLPTD